MGRSALRILGELIAVLLVIASVAGALGLVLLAYVHQIETARPGPAVAVMPDPEPEPEPEPEPTPIVAEPEPPAEEGPTPAVLAALAEETEAERRRAREAEHEAEALEASLEKTRARSQSLRERATAVGKQVEALEAGVSRLESELDVLAHQRDVLERERDEAKVELIRARSRDGYAVLPYKGTNGTWRRPIPIECRNGTATIQPGGPSFGLLDLALGARFRSSPISAAITTYLRHMENGPSPDGAPVVPYVLFVVRPDGIRPYYEARAALEPLGVAFGYELVDQDEEIEYPNLDDLAEWSETAPLPFARRLGRLLPELAQGDASGPEGLGPAAGPSGSALAPLNIPEDYVPVEPGAGPASAGGGMRDGPGSFANSIAPDALPGGNGPLGRETTATIDPGYVPHPDEGRPSWKEDAPGGSPGQRLGQLPDRGRSGWVGERQGEGASGDFTEEARRLERALAELRGHGDRVGGWNPTGSSSDGASAPSTGLALSAEEGTGRPSSGTSGPGDIAFRPERRIDIVVVCDVRGITIQPGGYRFENAALESGPTNLASTLRTLVRRYETREPEVEFKPNLTFLVEPGGQSTYWKARRQTVHVGLGWPARLKVVEGAPLQTGVGGLRR